MGVGGESIRRISFMLISELLVFFIFIIIIIVLQADSSGSGSVSAVDAAAILKRSNVPDQTLRSVSVLQLAVQYSAGFTEGHVYLSYTLSYKPG